MTLSLNLLQLEMNCFLTTMDTQAESTKTVDEVATGLDQFTESDSCNLERKHNFADEFHRRRES